MPLYVIDANSLQQKLALERSPQAVLLTDARELEGVPLALQQAAVRVTRGCTITPATFRLPAGGQETFVWLDGETLLDGAPEAIRRNLRHPGRASFVTIHLPCVANLDLLALQPRFLAPGSRREEAVDFAIRIGCGSSTHLAAEVFGNMDEPWATLSAALYRQQSQPGAGLAQLDRLRRDVKLPAILDALALRNLVVLQMRHNRPQQALKLLRHGKKKYGDYAELRYIEALLAMQEGDAKQAIHLLEEIIDKPKGLFAGSGGENTYRAKWLVGAIGDLAGNQSVSCNYYIPGVCARPAFEPSVIGLLKLRLPADVVDSMQRELCHLARREPRYLQPIFYFLLVHRAFAAAQRLLDTLDLQEEQRSSLADKLNAVLPTYRKRPGDSAAPAGIIFTGPFFVHSSIARINGELGASLLSASDFRVGLEPHGLAMVPPQSVPRGGALAEGLYRRPPYLDLTIRHHWPHDFSVPTAGKLAVIVPWEFGAVPRRWIEQIQKNVDELWVPSQFVKDVFERCGVAPERIAVVPNGVDTDTFSPHGKSWRPPEARGFTFLFVGGAIPRKGVDLLVQAYQRAFPKQDDVTLIIKDIGSKTFYRHMTLVPWLWKEAEKTPCPRLVTLLDEFDEARLAELYRGADAVVLPYRGEGFGMPLVEAMACGKPVIATAKGPAPEFCPRDCSYLIPAKTVPIAGGIEGFGDLSGEPTWFEPDLEELTAALRRVYERRSEAADRGARAGERIRAAYGWNRVTQMYLDRIAAITEQELTLAAPAAHSFK